MNGINSFKAFNNKVADQSVSCSEHPYSLISTFVVRWLNNIVYWAKVLPEQWELILIFRKHEIFRKNLRMQFQQAIIHLSKSLNFILIKCLKIT